MRSSLVHMMLAIAACQPPFVQAASPLPCTALATGEAELQWQGRRVPLPASLDDCRGARVAQGEVVACSTDRQGLPACRAFTRGESIDVRRFDPAGPVAAVAGLDRVLQLQRGGAEGLPPHAATVVPGRGADPLLPTRTVLLLDGQLLFDFSEPEMQGVERVDIRRDSVSGPVVASTPRTAGPTRIPAASLSDGPSYWAVPQPAVRPTQTPRRFNLAPPQERAEVLARLQAFDRQRAGPLATAMMRAAWLAQEDYDYDALVTMKSIGMRLR
jgi:hypothetical protein